MSDEFDVVVIGGGAAGENVAARSAKGGLRVALVESELVGGECSYWACMPSKALLRPGEALAAVRRVPGAAAAVTGDLDIAAALRSRDAFTSEFDDKHQVAWLEDADVELVRGHARLAGDRVVEVETAAGGRRLSARRAVVVATGSAAAIPPIDGLRDIRPWDSRDATSATSVPRSLVVLGGGPVGVEMAQAFSRLGAEQVTVVEASQHLLSKEEPFAGEELRAAFEAEGITVLTGIRMTGVRRDDGGPVTATLEDGRELVADELLVATGRRPRTDDLGLDTVGLEPGSYLGVDDQLRVNGVDGGWLYAVGDANGRSLLTHMGKYQARLAADHILGADVRASADHRVVPRVVFTDPQVAAVGLTAAQAAAQDIDVRSVDCANSDVAGAALLGKGGAGTSRIVVDTDRRVLVGATFTGPGVGEMLHAATIAIAGEVDLDTLWHAVPAFPTVSEVWLRLLEAYGL